MFRDAEKSYEANTGERVAHWQRRLLARYARNLALADHALMPGVFDLTVAARSIVDDNYAWEVWETAGRYPPQKTASDLETVQHLGRGGVARYQAHPAAAPASQRQTAAAPSGIEAAQEGKVSRRMGQASWMATASAPIRRKIW